MALNNSDFGFSSVGFLDNWIPSGNGIKNFPVVVMEFNVVDWVIVDNCTVVTCENGKQYKRPSCYLQTSPYGWEVV